jgi:hypothetical protein
VAMKTSVNLRIDDLRIDDFGTTDRQDNNRGV